MSSDEPLWIPGKERVNKAHITGFAEWLSRKTGLDLNNYRDLYQWSTDNIPLFWKLMWEYAGIKHTQPYQQVATNLDDMQECRWFEGARLNFAENLLRFQDDKTAIIFKGEGQELKSITYRELYREVAKVASSLRNMGIKEGDRVAGFLPNTIETVTAMLATTSLGAVWSSCSPDFGVQGALDRFGQIEPRILFTADGYYYNGKAFNSLAKIKEMLPALPSVEKVVVTPYLEAKPDINEIKGAILYRDFLPREEPGKLEFAQLPFDHPVYILYSSGTTGKPKCIVHGAGGTLLQHYKELALHTDLKREDIIFYFTTCGWMMWNWLVSSLALGATILLYDGNPFYPHPEALWKLAEDTGMTVFGASARYISALEQQGAHPGKNYSLDSIKSILSTGSPLTRENFYYVYREIKEDVCLSSISGGTDIISCFALGNPTLPVYPGELQCRGLGMKVKAYSEKGQPVINQKGELVCTAPFPSMPVYFWNDPERKKYRSAYFEVYPNVWHHGDFIEITERGSVIIFGRSDATLNPGGVRLGTAEIYRLVESLPEIEDSLAVGQQWQNDERIILFIKLAGKAGFDQKLENKIKKTLKEEASPRHIPAHIIPVPEIPYTINGKKVELAVKKVIHGEKVQNREALANPDALEHYRDLPRLKQ